MTARIEALRGFAVVITLASCTSSSPPAEPPPPDAASRGCLCEAKGCANGAVLHITTPVPHADLASTELEVCRQSSRECQRTPMLTSGTLSADDADTLVYRWDRAIDQNGDRFRVGIWKDDVLLFDAERDVTYLRKELSLTCYRVVNGKNELCPSHALSCFSADVDVLLARVADGGALTDASVDAPSDASIDAALDAPDAD